MAPVVKTRQPAFRMQHPVKIGGCGNQVVDAAFTPATIAYYNNFLRALLSSIKWRFVEGHNFDKRHPDQLRVKSGAADGLYDSIVTRIDNFDIGNSRILRPVARYPASAAAGWPPFAESDGSIGYEILQQFVVTFDYRGREVLLERSNTFGRKAVQGTTGFQAVKVGSEGFSVVTVLDDSPAAVAGMDVGDLITEIDGVPTGAMSRADFTVPFRRPAGTVALLSVSRRGSRQKVALTLKELLP